MPENENLAGEFVLNKSDEDKKIKTELASHDYQLDKGKKPHFFSSLCYMPTGVRFLDQEANETIILIIRRHFITNFLWLLSAAILLILPIFFPLIIEFTGFLLPSAGVLFLITLFYYLGIFGFVLLKFTLWYFHVGIVTSHRIRDIDIHGILYKDVSETKMNQAQDVNYSQIGFIRSVFNYGEVMVQTAGTHPNIEFDKAPRPAIIARIIGDMIGI